MIICLSGARIGEKARLPTVRKYLHGWRQLHQQIRSSAVVMMTKRGASDIAAVSPHGMQAD